VKRKTHVKPDRPIETVADLETILSGLPSTAQLKVFITISGKIKGLQLTEDTLTEIEKRNLRRDMQ
jgi:hypothetical protein